MSETFLEQEKVIEAKNATENEKIERIGDTISDSIDEILKNKNEFREKIEEETTNTDVKENTNADVKSEIVTDTMPENETFVPTKNGNISNEQDQQEEQPENDLENTSDTSERKEDEWIDILGSGAILKKIIRAGELDNKPQRNEKCTINYTAMLEDGTIVDSATNFEFYLSESDVISGLDVSVGLMTLHEKSLLKLQPRLAFGPKGFPPKIPADAVVTYDVELVAIAPEEDIEFLTIQQRKAIGNRKRERGNWWYMRGDNNIAIQCYRRALDYLDEVERNNYGEAAEEQQKVTDSDLQALLEDRISVCNNMAAAQIKMENYDAALNSLQTVLRCQPQNLKAHFRKAKAYIGKNNLEMAMKCLQKAKELSPDDAEIQKEINSVSKMLDKQKLTERELARRMFNGPKKDSSKGDGSKKNENKVLGLWTTVGAVIAVGVAGIVAYRFKYM